MKITYVVPELYRDGGIQEFAKTVYFQLSDYYDMELVDWKNILSLPENAFLKFLPPALASTYYTHFIAKKFKDYYKEIKNADFVHFWHPESAMAFLDKKYIVTCHGMEILPANMKGFRKERYEAVFNCAKLIHVNSNFTKRLLLNTFDIVEEKIRVINPPIENEKFIKNDCREKKRKPVIGTLARFNKRKNVPSIIKALKILREKYHLDFIYYLAGNGVEKRRIMQELKKAKFAWKYFGEISNEEKIKEFYPSLDIFVMPPLELPNDVEGFGIVYLEANACGIPVVASKTGGVQDAIKEGVSGVFADPANPEDIAAKILEVLENRDRFSDSAKEWAKRFDAKKIAKKFAEIYIEV